MHGWFLLRNFVIKHPSVRDHLKSELGVLSLLAIAFFLITNVLANYVMYGFLGQGIFGPWSLVACPVLITLTLRALTHSLKIFQSQVKQAVALRYLSKQRELADCDAEHEVKFKGVPLNKDIISFIYPDNNGHEKCSDSSKVESAENVLEKLV